MSLCSIRPLVLVLLVLGLAACPSRRVRGPMVPAAPQHGNAEARNRFEHAQARFLRDGTGAEAFREIVEEFPEDPIVPWAQLYTGIAAVRERKLDLGRSSLEQVIASDADPKLAQRAELFLGIAHNYAGEPRAALPLLARGEKMIEGDDERTEWLAAVAYATAAASPQPLTALRWLDQLYPRVSPTERALIVARAEELVAAAEPDALRRQFDELTERKGPGLAAVASRLVVLADQVGNASEAQQLREAAAPARAAVGLPRTISAAAVAAAGPGQPGLLGAVMPFGGSQNRIAEQAVAGLSLVTGAGGGPGVAAIELRTAPDAPASEVAVDELARGNVIALVGPIDGASVDAAAARAESLGVPLLSLSPAPEKRTTGKFVFHMRHSPEARARSLARTALARGVTKFLVLRPDNGLGRAVGAAFADEVKAGGGSVVNTVSYAPDAKSFGFGGKLGRDWQAVFIPDNAERLGLITPVITAAGHIPKPIGTKRVTGGGRPVVLLSTAENLTSAYLADAGRHSEGALLAPGYYPDDQDPTQKPFLDRFIAAFGRAPGVNEAYAYDAAQLAASVSSGGRAGLAAALPTARLVGLTGAIQFDADHRRSDPGVLYTVVEDAGSYAIRVARPAE